MQALYHLPSLGQNLDLSIVYMEFQAKQPAGLPTYGGERGKLLDSFCAYQTKLNKKSDSDPEHWDMGLYLSGLDFYAVEGGKNSYVTMGIKQIDFLLLLTKQKLILCFDFLNDRRFINCDWCLHRHL